MPPAPLPTATAVASAGPKATISRSGKKQAHGLVKSSSTELLDHVNQTVLKNSLQSKPLHTARSLPRKAKPPAAENGKHVSRLELLLAPKRPEAVYTPAGDTLLSQKVNKAIKLSAQWTDVQQAVRNASELSPSNVAYAIYRLGCLHSFASRKRREELWASGLVTFLLGVAQAQLSSMDAGSVTLLLDGCARLGQQPSAVMLGNLSEAVRSFALSFDASQLPLILWAFQTLQYTPRGSILAALDNAVDRLARTMSPQGVSLTLQGFKAATYCPSQRSLHRLAESLHRQLFFFKPSEVAACLEAFSAFDYNLPAPLIQAVANQHVGSPHSNIVTGKRALTGRAAIPNTDVRKLMERHAQIVEHGSRTAADGIAAAGRLLKQVGARVGELDDALSLKSHNPLANGNLRHT